MKKIAILRSETNNDYSGDDGSTIVKSITEWTEVSEEDYKILVKQLQPKYYQGKYTYYNIIEFIPDQQDFIRCGGKTHASLGRGMKAEFLTKIFIASVNQNILLFVC